MLKAEETQAHHVKRIVEKVREVSKWLKTGLSL